MGIMGILTSFYLFLLAVPEAYWSTTGFELASVSCVQRIQSLSRDPDYTTPDSYRFRIDAQLRARDEVVAFDIVSLPFRKGRGPRMEYVAVVVVDPNENINEEESRVQPLVLITSPLERPARVFAPANRGLAWREILNDESTDTRDGFQRVADWWRGRKWAPQSHSREADFRVPEFRILKVKNNHEVLLRVQHRQDEKILIARLIPAHTKRASHKGHLLDLVPEGMLPLVLVGADPAFKGTSEDAASFHDVEVLAKPAMQTDFF